MEEERISIKEVTVQPLLLKKWKAPGVCGISAEMLIKAVQSAV